MFVAAGAVAALFDLGQCRLRLLAWGGLAAGETFRFGDGTNCLDRRLRLLGSAWRGLEVVQSTEVELAERIGAFRLGLAGHHATSLACSRLSRRRCTISAAYSAALLIATVVLATPFPARPCSVPP